MPWGPNWQNHSWRSWIQKKTILKYPFFGAIVNGQYWGLIYEKMPCLTYWNKNVWSLGSKNVFEHKFWLKNSALRATYIISINKKDPVYNEMLCSLYSHSFCKPSNKDNAMQCMIFNDVTLANVFRCWYYFNVNPISEAFRVKNAVWK